MWLKIYNTHKLIKMIITINNEREPSIFQIYENDK